LAHISDDPQDTEEFLRRCEAMDAIHAEGAAENEALALGNEELHAAVLARQARLRDFELETEREEARARAQLERLQSEVGEERAQVAMLGQLLRRAKEDAQAVEAAELFEAQCQREAAAAQHELGERRFALGAMRGELEQELPRGLEEGAVEQRAELERAFAQRLTEDLRTELALARGELAAQQRQGDELVERARALEEELHAARTAGGLFA